VGRSLDDLAEFVRLKQVDIVEDDERPNLPLREKCVGSA
jgi:hypothetical protein